MASKKLDEKSIFNVAREIDSPEARAEYLDQACGEDHSLLERVTTLLQAYEGQASFLDAPPPAVAPTIDQPVVEQAGSMIGPYKLHEEIGEGGMGSVFLAVQKEPIKRKVAIKVIKPGMDSKQVVRRFEAERQALAMMDHPNIAKIHDGGATESGRPYFVMELVKGIPITDYCDRYRLTTNERLVVFGDVCRAVQHAHQKGIIHRDLKPSNIMVTQLDGRAIPKVIDFGIAKAMSGHLTDDSLVTAHAQMVGTPMYMSPEQADISAMDVDTRSDVYSLGVLLYELLTGTTPFHRERLSEVSYDEFRRIIREEEPPRPSTRLSTLDAALDTVADKHHTDPRTLSNQVSGELDWIVMKSLEKDRTRRYESANELAKDVQRYLDDEAVEACPPSTTYRLGKFVRRNKLAFITTSAVMLALTVGAGLATWQAIRATDAERLAGQRLDQVDTERKRAETNFDLAMLALDEVYLKAIGEERLLGEETQSPDDEMMLQPVLELSQFERELIQRGLAFYDRFAEQNRDNPRAAFETGKAFYRVALLQSGLEEGEEAQAAYTEAIARLKRLTEQHPLEAKYFLELGKAYYGQGQLSRWRPAAADTFADARNALDRAIELDPKNVEAYRVRSLAHKQLTDYEASITDLRTAVRIAPNDGESHRELSLRLAYFGDAKLKDHEEALQHAKIAVKLQPKDSNNHLMLADAYRKTGDFDAAFVSLEKAAEAASSVASARAITCRAHLFRGHSHRLEGRYQEALDAYSKASELDVSYAESYAFRADTHRELGNPEEALADYDRALKLKPSEAWIYQHRAATHLKMGNPEKALTDHNKAIELEPSASHYFSKRAATHLEMGNPEKALADHKRAIELEPSAARYVFKRADTHRQTGNLEAALTDHDQALRLDPDNSQAYYLRGATHHGLGNLEQALADCDKAVELAPGYSWAYNLRGETHLGLHNLKKALADFEQSLELNPKPAFIYKRCAAIHFQFTDYDEALADIAKAVELNPKDLSALTWIAPSQVAKCPDESFRNGLLGVAGKAIELNHEAARAYAARGWILAAFGQEEKALADLKTAFAGLPKDDESGELDLSSAEYELGNLCGQLAHRREAIPYLVQMAEIQPENVVCWYRAALAQLGAGQTDSYRESCRAMLQQFQDTEKPADGYCVAWTCLLAADAVDDYGPVVRLAEAAVEADPDSDGYLKTLGGALYRAGRFEEAVERLTEANNLIEDPEPGSTSSPVYTWYFLAMAHQAAGDPAQAREWLDKANEWTDKVLAERTEETATVPWNRKLTLRLFRKESEEMIAADTGESSEESNEATTAPPAAEDAAR